MTKKLYEIIIDDILRKIENNEFSFDKPICTEKSICEEHCVSRITAKKAIDELQQRGILYRKRGVGSFVINNDLAKSNFLDNQAENNSENTPRKIVAFIMPFDIPTGGIFKTIQAINNIMQNNNILLTIKITNRDINTEKKIIEQLCNEPISALIYYPATHHIFYKKLLPLINKNIPIIVTDISCDCSLLYNVLCDNINGQQLITQHLIDLGHKKIAYITEKNDDIPSVRDRFLGYAKTLSNNGIPFSNDFVCMNTVNSKDKLKSIIKHLISLDVTAIEVEHDELAFNVFLSCRSLNLKIPEDIAITGFDDSSWATLFDISLTTVKQDFETIGNVISDIIISSINGNPPKQTKYILPVELIKRDST